MTKKGDEPEKKNSASIHKMTEKEIDENLEESFPASDPPSWTLGSDHQNRAEEETESSPAQKSKF